MRVSRSRKKWVLLRPLEFLATGAFAAVALASPSFNFTSTPLVTANLDNKVQLNSDRIKLQTKHPTAARVAHSRVRPVGSSGWHHHPGFVIVSVKSGSVTVREFRLQPGDVRGGLRVRRERR